MMRKCLNKDLKMETISVDDFYNFIISKMTPEEALKRFIESSLISYEKLKFNDDKPVHPLMIIAFAAMDLGWGFAIEKDQENVRGLAVGTEEYLNNLFKEEK